MFYLDLGHLMIGVDLTTHMKSSYLADKPQTIVDVDLAKRTAQIPDVHTKW